MTIRNGESEFKIAFLSLLKTAVILKNHYKGKKCFYEANFKSERGNKGGYITKRLIQLKDEGTKEMICEGGCKC